MRTALLLLLAIGLAGCFGAPTPLPKALPSVTEELPDKLPERLRSCPAMPPPLPTIRTPEAVRDREKALDQLYRECAERHRQVVAEYDKLNGAP